MKRLALAIIALLLIASGIAAGRLSAPRPVEAWLLEKPFEDPEGYTEDGTRYDMRIIIYNDDGTKETVGGWIG